jgi:hypothetical protein
MAFLSGYARGGLSPWACGTATFIDGNGSVRYPPARARQSEADHTTTMVASVVAAEVL